MRTRRLGSTDLSITPIGLGAWAFGGTGGPYPCGPQDDLESIATIERAIGSGMNWIDTASAYGRGHSEELIGRALKGRTERPYVFSKCSFPWTEDGGLRNGLEPHAIRAELEGSLRRLGVDVIDLYQIHWPIPDEDIEEGWATLAELKAEGKVRAIGVSNFDVAQMSRLQAIAPTDSLQAPYSLLDRGIEEAILPFCEAAGIGVIVYSPMASGLLTGSMTRERIARLPKDDSRRDDPKFREPLLSRNLAVAECLQEIGARVGCWPGQLAVAWTLEHPAVTGAIVGCRRAAQVDAVLGPGELQLDEAERAELNALAYRESS